MDLKTLRVLEADKILDILKSYTTSELGRKEVERLLPSSDIEEVRKRQDETEEAIKLIINEGNPPLYAVKSIEEEKKILEIGGTLTPRSLLKVSDILKGANNIHTYLKNSKEKSYLYPNVERYIDELWISNYIENKISKVIISEEEISDNASKELRNIRENKIKINHEIKNKLNSIIHSQKMQKYLQDSIITIRNDRYVIPIKQEFKRQIKGIVHDTSSSGATIFIEPISIVTLNNKLNALFIEEDKEIQRILEQLSDIVRKHTKNLSKNQNLLGKIDLIFAKGKYALDIEGCKPILNDKGYVNLKEVKHPLIDEDKVVPIDIYIGYDFDTLVITGPNTGGKTVTLKTIGLCVLMAQMGMHIPAKRSSELAIFNNVYADIGDEQSIEQNLSTFSSHMTNIINIIDSLEENSLILFDELGAGTDPTEGAGLAMSILDYLSHKNVKTIATTHYSQLKTYALTQERVENASVEFDIKTLRPTYKLLIGIPGKSNAFEISYRLGLSDKIINNAKSFISKENIEFENILKEIDSDRKKAEKERYKLEQSNKRIKLLESKIKKKEQELIKKEQQVMLKAREEARKIIRETRKKSDTLIKELTKDYNKSKTIHEIKRTTTTKISEIENKIYEENRSENSCNIENFRVGDQVQIISLGQEGSIIDIVDKEHAVIQAGIMKLNVPLKNLKKIKSKSEREIDRKTKSLVKSKNKNVKDEIDLRGMNIEEAIIDLEKYIDDVYMVGMKTVYIIHGKGTGALKKGLQPFFKSHPLIKEFREGKFGEGGEGVTVLTIK